MSTQVRAPHRVPKFRHHKASGQGYVCIDGRALYLGPHEKPETLERYHQFIAEWLAAGRQLRVAPEELTINELLARFWTHALTYYRKASGDPTSELTCLRLAFRPLKELYGTTRAQAFKPLALKAVRQRMVDRGGCRTTVNKHISRIKLLFRWGVENELVSGETYHALTAVAGLRRGRCEARESEPVRPVPGPWIEAIRPYVSRQVWAMIQLQLLTGARAGEIVTMRPCDLDTSGRVWIYSPVEHKTAHHGHRRFIYLGPRAQQVIAPFLAGRATDAALFSPADGERERRAARHADRRTPLSCGNRPGTNRKERARRRPGTCYDVAAYRRAIARACDLAFPPPEHLARQPKETHKAWRKRLTADQKRELAAWQREHRWHPHQLRHNAATELRREFGLDAARVILGHRSPTVTDIYAELDHTKAVDAMLRVG